MFDQPRQTVARYASGKTTGSPFAFWRFNNKIRTMPHAKMLRFESLAPVIVHWGVDGWLHMQDLEGIDDVIARLTVLRSAWAQMLEQGTSQPVCTNVIP